MQLKLLDQETVKNLFDYDYTTGKLYWKENVPGNNMHFSKEAGNLANRGYRSVCINNKQYLVHRIIWLYYYGYFPENSIDHINRNKEDNRIENLREVSLQCNQRNSKVPITNTSLIKGLNWDSKENKWKVRITVNNKNYLIGRYSDYTEAACTRLAVEQCLDWNTCDEYSSAYQFIQKYIRRNNE